MRKFTFLILPLFTSIISYGQRIETIYLNAKDRTANMYIAVTPENNQVKSFIVLLDGFGNSPQYVLFQTDIPEYASQQGIFTIIPLLKTGPSYFRSDLASQQLLKEIMNLKKTKK